MLSRLLSTRQIKAARALLGWTRKDLANESGMIDKGLAFIAKAQKLTL